MRDRGDGAGEAAVVDRDQLLVGVRRALEDRQVLPGDLGVDAAADRLALPITNLYRRLVRGQAPLRY